MRPSEELSLTLSSELILKVGKLSVTINNDIPVAYYDIHLVNTDTMATPLIHGDMSCLGMYVRQRTVNRTDILSRYRSSISVLLTVGYLTLRCVTSLVISDK